MKIKVKDLKPGDAVDLEGDPYADPNHDHIEYECEFQAVAEVVQETPECTVVYFDNCACGFPTNHELTVDRRGEGVAEA